MNENRYAILIANSTFPDEPRFTPLRCPEKDADELEKVLRSEQSNFAEVVVLKNQPYWVILKTISQTLRRGGKDDLFLIYYSGHGKLDIKGNLYLATADTMIDDLLVTAIEATKILEIPQEHFKKKTVLILDCCYSGAIERRFKNDAAGMLETTFKSDSDEISRINDKLKKVNRSQGTYVLTASTSNQQAVEKEGDELSLFTKHIIEGISTGDASKEGEITMSSLYEYVRNKVADEGHQEPMKFETEVQGSELVISSVDVTKFSPQKFSMLCRELILVKYAADIPEDIQSEVINILGLNRELFTPEQKKKFTLIQNLIKNPKTVEGFVAGWNDLKKQQEHLVEFYEEARSAVKAEEWPQAVKKLRAVLEIDPEHKQASADLALAQQQLKLADLYKQGKDFYDSKEFGKAIPYLERIHEFFPTYKDVANLLSKSQTENTRRDQHEQEKKEHEELDKKQKEAHAALEQTYNIGMEHFAKGEWTEALKHFYQVRDKNADFADLKTLIEDSNTLIEADEAIITQDLQKLTAARDKIQKVSVKNPKRWKDYKSRISDVIGKYLRAEHAEANKLYSAGEFRAALELYVKIKSVDENFDSIDTEIVETRKKLAQLSAEFLASNEETAVPAAKDIDKLFYEARTAIGAQQFTEAIEKLQKALILKPHSPELLEELEKAKRQQTLATLYAAAKERLDAKDWQGALGNLYSIKDKQEFYKDVDELIQLAESDGEKPVAKAINQSLLIGAAIIGGILLIIIIAAFMGGESNSTSANNNNRGGIYTTLNNKSTPTPSSVPYIPSEDLINWMVGTVMQNLSSAVQKGDYTAHYNTFSSDFKAGKTLQKFAQNYHFTRSDAEVLASAKSLTPKCTSMIDKDGFLLLKCVYSGKNKIDLKLWYVYEDGIWKLAGDEYAIGR